MTREPLWECERCGWSWPHTHDPFEADYCGECGGTLVDVQGGRARQESPPSVPDLMPTASPVRPDASEAPRA